MGLVVLPPGSSGVVTTSHSARPLSTGLSRIPSGLYLNKTLIDDGELGKSWIYSPATKSIREIGSSQMLRDETTYQHFRRFCSSSMWKNVIEPEAEREVAEYFRLSDEL